MIEELKNKIFSGEMITKDEAMSLIDAPIDELCKSFVTMYLTYVQ